MYLPPGCQMRTLADYFYSFPAPPNPVPRTRNAKFVYPFSFQKYIFTGFSLLPFDSDRITRTTTRYPYAHHNDEAF